MNQQRIPLYTKTGDSGQTSLFGGQRVAKNHPRIELCGTIDELNAELGLAIIAVRPVSKGTAEKLVTIQHNLFAIGSEIASPPVKQSQKKAKMITDAWLTWLERETDQLDNQNSGLTNFILPGGGIAAAHLHRARTIARKAERLAVTLNQVESVRPLLMKVLNRLSDFLFAAARACNRLEEIEDVAWQKDQVI